MKLKNIFKFATVVALPFAFISCKESEEKKDDDSGDKTEKPEEGAITSHAGVGKEFAECFTKLGASLTSIKDVESAKAMVGVMKEQAAKMMKIATTAGNLDAPNAVEKTAMQALKDTSMGAFMKAAGSMETALANNPAKAEIKEALAPAMENEDFNNAQEKMKEIYGLE